MIDKSNNKWLTPTNIGNQTVNWKMKKLCAKNENKTRNFRNKILKWSSFHAISIICTFLIFEPIFKQSHIFCKHYHQYLSIRNISTHAIYQEKLSLPNSMKLVLWIINILMHINLLRKVISCDLNQLTNSIFHICRLHIYPLSNKQSICATFPQGLLWGKFLRENFLKTNADFRSSLIFHKDGAHWYSIHR